MKKYFSSISIKKKVLIIIVVVSSFIFTASVAIASITISSSGITSNSTLTLTPASDVVINGQLSVSGVTQLSAEEKAYWQDKAALLDPAAYEFVSGNGWTRTVPAGQTWYAVSQYRTDTASQEQIHQRLGDVEQAIMLPAGTTIAPGQYAYLYINKPSLVTGSDSRYTTNPKGLYYSRLNNLRSLSVNYLSVSVPSALATGATATANFPADFTKGLVVGVSATEISWGGMQYMENGEATGAVNLQNEINNYHTLRFAQGVKFPFDRTVMPGIMAAAGNHAGISAATSTGGGFIIVYIKLPNDW